MSFNAEQNKYLKEIYEGWKNLETRNSLFGNLPSAYNTNCPPIPWMGDLNKSIVIVSLEPLLSNSFDFQIQETKEYQKWKDFYLTNQYFERLYANNRFPAPYWKRLACFIKGYCNKKNQDDWIEILKLNAIEFPFLQYHACSHPSNFTPTQKVEDDFEKRLKFLSLPKDQIIVIVYGVSKWRYIKRYLNVDGEKESSIYNGVKFYYSNSFKGVIVLPQNSRNKNYSNEELFNIGEYLRDI